jgi:hypothetical protein
MNFFDGPAMRSRTRDAILQNRIDVDAFSKVTVDVFAQPLHSKDAPLPRPPFQPG